MSNVIDLSNRTSNYIDLAGYGDTVTITGKYRGDRIVIKNAVQKTIEFSEGYIITQHIEDALCFAGEVRDCRIIANNFTLEDGGITFWGLAENVDIIGFKIMFPHTGIRINSDLPHRNVSVQLNEIIGCSHEGIYLGVSERNEDTQCEGLKVIKNLIDTAGWDGIQTGNWVNSWIIENKIYRAGMKKAFGQRHGVCINPGSQVWDYENELIGCEFNLIVNDATLYKDTKPKGWN